MALLEVKNLVKKYGRTNAVNGVSFTILPGTCFGLLGPNGAGKTTTIEVIEDIIAPSDGEILYKGRPRTDTFRAEVGILFQQTALLSFLTVHETLATFQGLYTKTADLQELIAMCHLQDFLNQYNDRISGGQRQRFMLALALVNKPELVFLDEPSTGLDPQARRNLWDIVQNIKAGGRTIILTTHNMEEAQSLCDEIAIMDYGRIIARGSPAELIKRNCGSVTVVLPVTSFNPLLPSLSVAFQVVQDRVEIMTDDLNSCVAELVAKNVDLKNMTVRSPNLEDVFLTLTGRQLRE
ncbi:MAG: ABC transporter ATP-binding protein [Deltaproteobacteria bacterium]|nr:ABC transporter ATP-binding protein [Deltaproteobacteria bacterium]